MNDFHTSVLKKEALELLQIKEKQKYIDATLGGGGHSFEILKRGGKVLGIDADSEAIEEVKRKRDKELKGKSRDDLTLFRGNFKDLETIAEDNGFDKVAGIIFDLGLSSHQLDKGERGFSFRSHAPLDMRMDLNLGVTAKDLVNKLDERRLNEVFKTYGQEELALPISRSIAISRKVKPIEFCDELAKLVEDVYFKQTKGKFKKNRHPATKVFQALRIVVNSEIFNLEEGLAGALKVIGDGGRLVVISYHSLEDRIVKNFFNKNKNRLLILTKKPILPTEDEVRENFRARSAKLRAAEKLGVSY